MSDSGRQRASTRSVYMLANELAPYTMYGGVAYALQRLAQQFAAHEVSCTIWFPGSAVEHSGAETAKIRPIALTGTRAPDGKHPFIRQCEQARDLYLQGIDSPDGPGIDPRAPVIAHDNECALFVPMMRQQSRHRAPLVFWLHSLHDRPRVHELPPSVRRLLAAESLLASAIDAADLVVASSGIVRDAGRVEWHPSMRATRRAIIDAHAQDRIVTVEASGCLPSTPPSPATLDAAHERSKDDAPVRARPYVLFPGRAEITKGLMFFVHIARTLRHLDVDFVGVGTLHPDLAHTCRDAAIKWLPWMPPDRFAQLVAGAACVVTPSATEGYGLAAAEAARYGRPLLYQDTGGLQVLASYANADAIPLTHGEREVLYRLWGAVVASGSEPAWAEWSAVSDQLRALKDRWVEGVRECLARPISPRPYDAHVSAPAQRSWAARLLEGAAHLWSPAAH